MKIAVAGTGYVGLKGRAMQPQNIKLAIIGLGYVGLPLAVEFGRKRSVVLYDLKYLLATHEADLRL